MSHIFLFCFIINLLLFIQMNNFEMLTSEYDSLWLH